MKETVDGEIKSEYEYDPSVNNEYYSPMCNNEYYSPMCNNEYDPLMNKSGYDSSISSQRSRDRIKVSSLMEWINDIPANDPYYLFGQLIAEGKMSPEGMGCWEVNDRDVDCVCGEGVDCREDVNCNFSSLNDNNEAARDTNNETIRNSNNKAVKDDFWENIPKKVQEYFRSNGEGSASEETKNGEEMSNRAVDNRAVFLRGLERDLNW